MSSRQKKFLLCFGLLVTGLFMVDVHAAITHGPRISQVTRNSAVITWFTNTETVQNKVIWGRPSALTNQLAEDQTSHSASLGLWKHVAHLNGLSTRSEYAYKVVSDGEESPVFTFLTAVQPGQPFKFALVSDLHTVPKKGALQLEHAIQSGIDFWVHAGDTVHEGEDIADWETYFALYNRFPNPYGVSKNFWASHAVYDTFSAHTAGYPAPYEGLEPYVFFYTIPNNCLPWKNSVYDPILYRQEITYAFGYGNVYFVAIASEKKVTGADYGDQVDWLAEQLQYSIDQGYDFRIVYSHRMGYTNAGIAYEAFQRQIQPLLEQYDVALYFGGHYHSYNRCIKNGVSHVTIGTGGASTAYSDANKYPENETTYGCTVNKLFNGHAHAEVSVSSDTMTMNVIRTAEPRDVIDSVTWTTTPDAPPEPSPRHRWKLDEGTGTVADDSIGDLPGILINGTAWTDGRMGSAITLDGIDDRVEIADFDPPSTGTLDFWVKIDDTPTSIERILGGKDSFEVRLLTDGRLAADVFQSGNNVLKSNSPLTPGAWHHVAITWKLNTSTEIYLDGTLDASGAFASTDPGTFTFSLGTRTGRSDYFEGQLDDVAIYDYQLNAVEIQERFNITFDTDTLTFTPEADTYVDDASPNDNRGSSRVLWVDDVDGVTTDSEKHSYLRFRVAGLAGATVTAVRLRMYNIDGSPEGGRIWTTSSNTWDESTVTWNNRPSIDGPQIGEFGPVSAGSWYETPLSLSDLKEGALSLVLDSTTINRAKWRSREDANQPQLLVDIQVPN